MTRSSLVAVAIALSSAHLFSSGLALAGDKTRCASSYAESQRARKRGELGRAKTELATCLAECTEAVRADCVRWLSEVETAMPSLTVSVRRGGADVPSAAVQIDERAWMPLGRAVELDPGRHVITVREGGESKTTEVVLAEGERGRHVVVELAPVSTAPPTPGPPGPPLPYDRGSQSSVPTPTIVLGVVGLAGLATFGALGLYGNARYADLEKCKPTCSTSDVDATRTTYLIGDVGLAVGVVSLGVAAAFYFASGSDRVASAPKPWLTF